MMRQNVVGGEEKCPGNGPGSFTVYAKRVPTHDSLQHIVPGYPRGKMDVLIAKDPEFKDVFCIWGWRKNPPTRRNRYVTLNCFRWRLVWPAVQSAA